MGSAFAAENFSEMIVDWLMRTGIPIPAPVLESASVIFITIVLSYFTLMFGELLPKQIGMRKSQQLALGLSGLIHGVAVIFAPLVSVLTLSTNGILRLFGMNPNQEEEYISEEEIRMMVDVGSKKGTIDPEEKQMIQNVFEFDDLTAGEIATHRTEVITLNLEDSIEEWKRIIDSSIYTRFPVCQETADYIVGILDTKVYFRMEDRTKENILKIAVSPAFFVPHSIKADTLFHNMKREKVSLAVVLDEYGGMAGIITIQDLVEKLVGELENDVS
jgi:putative hemolysin